MTGEMLLDEGRGGRPARVTSNPSRLNALTALVDEFIETFSPLAADAELRVLVLTGPAATPSSAAPTLQQ
jgi:enoyl-CoA hydratase/carnithine racemase